EIGARRAGMADRIAELGKGQKPRVRRAVAWALGGMGGEEAIRHLRKMVSTDPSKFTAGMALLGIPRRNAEEAVDLLRPELVREALQGEPMDTVQSAYEGALDDLKAPR